MTQIRIKIFCVPFQYHSQDMLPQLQQANAHERGASTVAKVAIVLEQSSYKENAYVCTQCIHSVVMHYLHLIYTRTYTSDMISQTVGIALNL